MWDEEGREMQVQADGLFVFAMLHRSKAIGFVEGSFGLYIQDASI